MFNINIKLEPQDCEFSECPKTETFSYKGIEEVNIKSENMFRSEEFSGEQQEAFVNSEDSKTLNKTENIYEIFFDDFNCKELDIKHEVPEGTETRFFSKPLETSIKTENSETINETEKWPGIAFDNKEIKREEVDLTAGCSLKSQISISEVRCNQKKYDLHKEHKCPICDYQTKLKGNLKKHLLRHKTIEEEDLLHCNVCEYQTHNNIYLRKHLLRHKKREENNFFKCSLCEYQTLYKHQLNNHSLRHTNPEEANLFKCDICEYRTRYRNALKRHALQHKDLEEEDFFRCDKCEYKTRYNCNLRKHLLRHGNDLTKVV